MFQIFRFDIGFFHDRIDILLASFDSMLVEDLCDLGRAIDLMRIVVDLDDCFFVFSRRTVDVKINMYINDEINMYNF